MFFLVNGWQRRLSALQLLMKLKTRSQLVEWEYVGQGCEEGCFSVWGYSLITEPLPSTAVQLDVVNSLSDLESPFQPFCEILQK